MTDLSLVGVGVNRQLFYMQFFDLIFQLWVKEKLNAGFERHFRVKCIKSKNLVFI